MVQNFISVDPPCLSEKFGSHIVTAAKVYSWLIGLLSVLRVTVIKQIINMAGRQKHNYMFKFS